MNVVQRIARVVRGGILLRRCIVHGYENLLSYVGIRLFGVYDPNIA
jgi:hypothetical protein